MTTKKDRRHSGRITPVSTISMPQKFLIENCLEPQEFYDDWQDYRDSQRNFIGDMTKIKKFSVLQHLKNHKHKKAIEAIRRTAKEKRFLKIRKIRKIKHDKI